MSEPTNTLARRGIIRAVDLCRFNPEILEGALNWPESDLECGGERTTFSP